jgi:hypothetical protein
MRIRTERGLPRGARADAETGDTLFVIKRVSHLRATFQLRLLAYLAQKQGRRLVIDIPLTCSVHRDLSELIASLPDVVKIVRN